MLKAVKRAGSPYWQITGSVGNVRVRKSAGTTDRAQAEAQATELDARLRREALYGKQHETTFAEAAVAYIEAKDKEGSEIASPALARLIPRCGTRTLASFSSGEVQDLAKEMFPQGTAATRNRHCIVPFMAVYNHAVVRKQAPPMKVERFKEKKAKTRSVDGAWIEAVRDALTDPFARAMVRLMFETGMRLGTVLALEPNMVDVGARVIRVPGAILKNDEDHDFILSSGMAAELAALPKPGEFIKGAKGCGRWRRDDALLFGYRYATGFYKQLKRACKKAGVEYVPPHQSGRHSFATTYIVDHKIDPVTVAELGGWKDPAFLLKRYPHAREAKLRGIVERVTTGTEKPKLKVVR